MRQRFFNAFFTCDFVKLFTECDCDLYRYILESHIAILQNAYETHSMCDVAHTCATVILILQSHHMNSLIDIHTTQSHSERIAPCEQPFTRAHVCACAAAGVFQCKGVSFYCLIKKQLVSRWPPLFSGKNSPTC